MRSDDTHTMLGKLMTAVAEVSRVQERQGHSISSMQIRLEEQTEIVDELKEAEQERARVALKEETDRAERAREEEYRRTMFWWKLLVGALITLSIPTLTFVWQGGRLTEKIEQLSNHVNAFTTDHELRIRSLEQH